MKTIAFILAFSAACMADVLVILDVPVERGHATYSALTIRHVQPHEKWLDVQTTLGQMRLCYPSTDTIPTPGCSHTLTPEESSTPASEFIKTTVPALVKAWAQGE